MDAGDGIVPASIVGNSPMSHDHPSPGSSRAPDRHHGHGDAGHDRPGRDHAVHRHDDAAAVTTDSERRVFFVMLLTGLFMVAEAAGGLLAGSLTLVADAGHMLTDTAALAFAWFAFRVARRPSDARRSYGYHRFQVLAAFVNGLALVVLAGWITVEAVRRLAAPVPVLGGPMLGIAVFGLAVNIVAFVVLHRGDRGNLNMRGALLHVAGDLLGSAGAIVAAAVILLTGWTPIDPILSVVVALLILRSAWAVVRHSTHILVEGTPHGLDPAQIGAAIRAAEPQVEDVHHVHAWSLTAERPLVTLHVTVNPDADPAAVLAVVKTVLQSRFGITHATVQVEPGGCPDRDTAARDAAQNDDGKPGRAGQRCG